MLSLTEMLENNLTPQQQKKLRMVHATRGIDAARGAYKEMAAENHSKAIGIENHETLEVTVVTPSHSEPEQKPKPAPKKKTKQAKA